MTNFFNRLTLLCSNTKALKVISITVLKNITTNKIITIAMGVPLDNYKYQTINNFEKLLAKKDKKNITITIALILIIICIYIRSNRFLQYGVS